MIRLFYILLHGCDHKWRGVANGRFSNDFGERGPIAYCVCEKCGRPKSFRQALIPKDGEKP